MDTHIAEMEELGHKATQFLFEVKTERISILWKYSGTLFMK